MSDAVPRGCCFLYFDARLSGGSSSYGFVHRYEWRSSAEFAKEAMSNKGLLGSTMVRYQEMTLNEWVLPLAVLH